MAGLNFGMGFGAPGMSGDAAPARERVVEAVGGMS